MGRNKAHGNRQRRQVNWISHRYPDAWQKANIIRNEQHQTWPDWCYVPINRWKDIVLSGMKLNEPTIEAIIDAGRLAALGAWRVTQGIYRFDPDLYAALIDTPLTGDIPNDLLYRLPSWGVYVETPGLSYADLPMSGFYAHLNQYQNGHVDLRLLIDGDTENWLFPVPIRLGEGSLINAIQAYIQVSIDHYQQHNPEKLTLTDQLTAQIEQEAATLAPMLSLLLYLCAEDADYEQPPGIKTCRPRSLGGKQRVVVIPENTRTWEVGTRLGAALRHARNQAESASPLNESAEPGSHARPRPHWRRAHWHTFWTGPLDGERVARLKWLPPIAVGLDGQELPAVVHRVL